MKKSNLSVFILKLKIFIFLFFVILSSCADDNPVKPKDNDDIWKIGETKDYNISGSQKVEIEDDISGLKFVFPNGGDGKLIVKEIIDGPEPSVTPNKCFAVSYEGDDTLLITVPHNKDDYDFLSIYSKITGVSLTNISKDIELWHSLSDYTETDSSITFIIPQQLIQGVKSKKEMLNTLLETEFAYIKILPNSTMAEVINLVKKTVKQDVDYIGTFLSDDFKQTYNNRYKLLKLTWSYVSKENDPSYFGFSNGWTGFYGDFGFHFSPSMNTGVIHHEAGHLINYLIYGVVDYESLWAKFGDIDHAMFSPLLNGRQQGLQEDVAYILENFISDNNSINLDLTLEKASLWDKVKSLQFDDINKQLYTAHPQDIDFPSLEGFSAVLVNQLTGTNTQMFTFDCVNTDKYYKRILKIPSPVLGFSFQDVLDNILLRKPQTINDVMRYIQEYLSTQNQDLLPKFLVRAEAMGWSYYGKVKIVDSKGNPVKNAEVLPIMQVGNSTRDFWTVSSYKSDAEGNCYVNRLYPGSQILRVFYNDFKDSMDFPLSIDWMEPTNKEIKIPDLVIDTEKYVKEYSSSWDASIYNENVNAKIEFSMSTSDGAFQVIQDVMANKEFRMIRYNMKEPQGLSSHTYNFNFNVSQLVFNRSKIDPEPRWIPQIDSVWVDVSDINGINIRKVIYGPIASVSIPWSLIVKSKDPTNGVSTGIHIFLGMVDNESEPPQKGIIGSGVLLLLNGVWP